MDEYLIWRMVKILGLALLASGFLGACLTAFRQNRILALQWASLGFALAWISGYAMLASPREELKEAWIVWSIAWSLVAMLLQALYVHGNRDRFYLGALATAALAGSFISMVLRDQSVFYWLLAQLTLLLLSFALFYSASSASRSSRDTLPANAASEAGLHTDSRQDAIQSWNWFKWVARFEGLSIILLMLIYMPLKYVAGIVLDGDTGLVGWIHGVMFVLYIGSLLFSGVFLGWSWKRMAASTLTIYTTNKMQEQTGILYRFFYPMLQTILKIEH